MAEAQAPVTLSTPDRKDRIFFSYNSLHLIQDLIEIFYDLLGNIQTFNKVVQGISLPQHRKHFFIERSNKPLSKKWHLLFKYLLRFHHLHEIGDILYPGFHYAGLKKQYIDIARQGGNYFLWPQGKGIISPQCELPLPLE